MQALAEGNLDLTASSLFVNYDRLQNLLAASQWQDADEETKAIMLKAANRESEGYLRAKDSDLLPYNVLNTIDKLWLSYSDGRFGFTVQKHIWLSASQNYTEFGDLVGWHVEGTWLDKSAINFSTSAKLGHLPALLFPSTLPGSGQIFSFVVGKWRTNLLSRKDL